MVAEVAALGLCLDIALFVHLYLADMTHFVAANAAYCRHLPAVSPSARACVQAQLLPGCPIMIEVLLPSSVQGASLITTPPPPPFPPNHLRASLLDIHLCSLLNASAMHAHCGMSTVGDCCCVFGSALTSRYCYHQHSMERGECEDRKDGGRGGWEGVGGRGNVVVVVVGGAGHTRA